MLLSLIAIFEKWKYILTYRVHHLSGNFLPQFSSEDLVLQNAYMDIEDKHMERVWFSLFFETNIGWGMRVHILYIGYKYISWARTSYMHEFMDIEFPTVLCFIDN
jgi:hypothetical protein